MSAYNNFIFDYYKLYTKIISNNGTVHMSMWCIGQSSYEEM